MPRTIALTPETREAWDRALTTWGVRLADPRLSPGAAADAGAPAWFSFPPSITVDPQYLADHGVSDELESIFAHEIGHHVLAPSTRVDSLKIRHQMARSLDAALARQPQQREVSFLANLWTDLLVNTRLVRLQRTDGAPPADVGIVRLSQALFSGAGHNRLWWVYLRTCELLWQLPAGSLCAQEPPPAPVIDAAEATEEADASMSRVAERHRQLEKALRAARAERVRIDAQLSGATTANPVVDAVLLAETVRMFAADPVSGAARFGVITAPYFRDIDAAVRAGDTGSSDAVRGGCADGQEPPTPEELGRILADQRMKDDLPPHPGSLDADGETPDDAEMAEDAASGGQAFDVAQTLSIYDDLPESAVLAAWYRSEAARWVRPYTRTVPSHPDGGIPGPVELWENGDPLTELDLPLTLRSGVVIPGVTTRRRSQLDDEPIVQETSIDLDLYIDSSGSMLRPSVGSPAVLAGTILALSVLRGGGRLRVTSFSGPGQVAGMPRFGRDSSEIISALCAFFGKSTSFPLDLYGSRYAKLPAPTAALQRHVVVLSDDGLVSMFGMGNEPYADVARDVRRKLTTGTLVLMDRTRRTAEVAHASGYDVIYLDTMADAPGVCTTLAEKLHG